MHDCLGVSKAIYSRYSWWQNCTHERGLHSSEKKINRSSKSTYLEVEHKNLKNRKMSKQDGHSL